MIKNRKKVLAFAFLPLVALGCTEDYNFVAAPNTFAVSPQFTSIDEGTTIQLTATGGDGSPAAVSWESNDTNILTVNSTGLVTAVRPGGPTNIIARLGAEAHSASITVVALQGTALTKGVPVTGLSGATGTSRLFRIFVPAGTTQLRFTLTGGSGDADLYVRRQTPPTNSSASFFSFNAGNEELVTVNNPASGTWYVLVDAFETYSGATLTATYTP